MAVTKKEIDLIIMAHDRASAKFRRIEKSGSSLGRTLVKLGGIAAGFVGFRFIARQTVSAINESIGFQKQLAEISTMLDGPATAIMKRYKREIMAMATEFGQSKETLSKGLYDILSAGVAAGDGLTVLRVAAKAAIGGVTDTATAVDALTTVMNAYGLQADQATKISDLMFSTVKEGKITYSELAENIGKIAPSAKAANVPLEELFGMLSTMVKVEKPERAFTALRAALMTSAKEGENFLEVVRKLRGADLQAIIGAGFAQRAAAGVSILVGNWQTLEEQIVKARESGGKADIAFRKMADTNAQKVAKMGEAWKNLKVAIGDATAESETFALVLEGFTALFKGYGLGRYKAELEISKDARTEYARRLKDYKEHLIRMRETPEQMRARELTERFRAEPGVDVTKIKTPLEIQPWAIAAKRREAAFATARRRITTGREAFAGLVGISPGARAPRETIATTKDMVAELKEHTRILQRVEQNTEVRVEGRRF